MKQLSPGLVRLAGSGPAAVHVALAEPVTLIDAGSPGRGPAIERQLRELGLTPRRIVLTHGDPDHLGALDHLRRAFGAETVAAAAERPLIERTAWPRLPWTRRLVMRAYLRHAAPPTIDRWIDGEETLDGLGVLPTPGHTPGHLAFIADGWLLPGDAVVTGRRFRESPRFFTLDRAVARRSIERLASLDVRGWSSSHGVPVASDDGLRRLIDTWPRADTCARGSSAAS